MITVMIIMMNTRWEASQCQWENGAILSASRWEPPLSLGFIIRMSIVKLVMMRLINEVAELISQYWYNPWHHTFPILSTLQLSMWLTSDQPQKSLPIARRKKPSLSRISSKQFLMTTILEEPYMMLRKAKAGELLRGNDRYEGYCKVIIKHVTCRPTIQVSMWCQCKFEQCQDLADLITSLTGIRFKIKPVNDSKYGSPDRTMVGGWNGKLVMVVLVMVGTVLTLIILRRRMVMMT